eukprot:g883.t1
MTRYFWIFGLLLLISFAWRRVPAKSKANVDIDSKIRKFVEWFEEHGGHSDGLVLEKIRRGKLRSKLGLRSTRDVSKGDVLMRVPYKIVISKKTMNAAIRSSKGRRAKKGFRKLRDEQKFIVFCMWEISKGSKSMWAPFWSMLKQQGDVSLPRTFSAAELAALQDEAEADNARKMRAHTIEEFGKAQEATNLIFGALKPSSRSEYWLSLETYMKWESRLKSVSLMIHGERILVPLANFLDYKYDPVPREYSTGEHFLKYHRETEMTFDIYADRSTPAGGQMFEDYGDNSNRVYLQHHGFVPPINPSDCIHVSFPFRDPHEAPVMGQSTKLKLLANVADVTDLLRRDPSWCIRPTEPLRDPMLYYLRVLEMDTRMLNKCRDAIQGTDGEEAKMAALRCFQPDASTDERVYGRLRRTLRRVLRTFPTSVEEDEELLRTAGDGDYLSHNERVAVTYRISRKRLIAKLYAVLEKPTDSARCDLEQQDHLVTLRNDLNSWIASKGVPLKRVEASLAPGRRLGLMTTEELATGEPFLAVPTQLVMDHASAVSPESALGPVIRELEEIYPQGDDYHNLLFHLIHERHALRNESYWWPYLKSLPLENDLHVPLFYSESVLEELEGSEVRNLVREYRENVANKFSVVQSRIFDVYPHVFLPGVFNETSYRWATAVLDSRAVWWDGKRHLVPLLDFVNSIESSHYRRKAPIEPGGTDNDDNVRVATAYDFHWDTAEVNGDGVVVARAQRDYDPGEALDECYGLSNWELFLYHGFVVVSSRTTDRGNPYDCFQTRFALDDSDPLFDSKQRSLQRRGMYSTTLRLCLAPGREYPSEMWTFLRIQHGLLDTDVVGPRERLLGHLRRRLDAYSTSVVEDMAILRENGSSNPHEEGDTGDGGSSDGRASLHRHRRVVVQMRFEEKKVLVKLIEKLQKWIARWNERSEL